ncbi:hypothetical protein [Alteromonas australica]|nr:hypothetical protein [Alteromonas australica]|tara:strand:+ start:40573 stop:40707 length:135 start_codon:yes stop_codon:yes gene_type:complete
MIKSWEEHKAEMRKEEANENRNILLFCGALFLTIALVIGVSALF